MIGAYTTEFRRLRRATNRKPAAFFAALVVFIIVILVAAPQAQQQSTIAGNNAPATSPVAVPRLTADGTTDIDLLVGRSTILNVGSPITRVSLTVPDIADALVTTPTQLLIHGKQPGTISLFVWDRGGSIKTFEVNVRRDLKVLVEQVKQLFPGEPITVAGSGKDVVLSGTVSSTYVREKAAEVAGGYVEKKENVVNLLKQQEGVASNQVMLRVRFAEVSRNALQELGASLFSDGRNERYGRVTTQQFAAPFLDKKAADLGKSLVFSDYLNLFLFDAKNQLGAVVKALQSSGVFQSLAEPNLIATNGKEASFLAGGEFPIPVVQGAAGQNAVTIMFKEFGVRLTFTPTVLGGDLVNIKLKPEVSSLDFNNAIVVEGFRIPALTTRRAETEVELRDGQTFAIAGLMNNSALSSMRKVPGLGDIPILGMLFRSRAYQKDQTELVVMVTPQIIRRGSTGVSEGLPSLVEPFLGPPAKTIPPPAPYVGSPRYPANQPAPRTDLPVPVPVPAPENAPAQAVPVQPNAPAQAPSTGAGQPVNAEPQPLESRPVGQQPYASPAPMTAPAEAPLTKDQLKALERAREEERRAAVLAARQHAEQAKKDEEERKRSEKLDQERAKREAEVARKNAELARKKAEEDQKREKALAEAAARLKQAQAAYQAELDKAKGGSNDKKNPGGAPRY